MRKKVFVLTIAMMLTALLTACGSSAEVRSISVEELNGTTHVTNVTGETDAYVGEKLASGDDVKVDADSNMTLLIDSDKHLFADAGTHFCLEATGKANATKTHINLYEGSVLSGIDNKLKADETYEVSTPNATMAVRGTVFNVCVTYVDGVPVTDVEVVEGTVAVTTMQNGEEITVEVGAGENQRVDSTEHDYTKSAESPDDLDGGSSDGISETSADDSDTDSAASEPIDISDGPTIDELSDVLASGSGYIFGVYVNGSMKYIIAPGVHRYQMSGDGLWDQHAPEDAPWMIHEYGDGSDPYFGSNFTVSGSSASDYTEREGGVHVMDLGLVVNGDTLTAYRYIEGELSEIEVYTRTGEDPVAAYNDVVSGYSVVNPE